MKTLAAFLALSQALLLALPAQAETKVACVGDSITFGFALGSPAVESYPAVLQELLGTKDFLVENFGESGATMRKQGDNPYWDLPGFAASTDFSPDAVVIMLGTNDAKPQNWDEDPYTKDYREMIRHYRDLGATVFVATPPPVYGNGGFDIDPETLNEIVVPRVAKIANDTDTLLIDVFAALSGRPENFADNVHPDAAGAELIAKTVAEALTGAPVPGAGSSGAGGGASGGATGGAAEEAGGRSGSKDDSEGGCHFAAGSSGEGHTPLVVCALVLGATVRRRRLPSRCR